MNYTQLKQAIQDYSETDESLFIANIPLFIKEAEERIYNTVHIPILRKNVTGNLTVSNNYLSCPDDFLAVYSVAIINPVSGVYSYLIDKDVSFMREAYPNPSLTGAPKYYALFGPQLSNLLDISITLTPTPDIAYLVEMHYFYYPESITTVTSGNTWLSTNYDPVLFYGAMREAMLFMKQEADIIANYETKYQEAVSHLERLCAGLERGDSYRNNQMKLPYTQL